MATMGDNHVDAAEMRLLIERAERIAEEIAEKREDMKDVMREAKSRGYETKQMRVIMKLRKMEPVERETSEALRDTYKRAIGL